jgi:hypothetical protein
MYKRFKWNPEVRWDEDTFLNHFGYLTPIPPNARVFIGSTMELFGPWVKDYWMKRILEACYGMDERNTFIFLTKQPERLINYSPFPDNCWVGVSATNEHQYWQALMSLQPIQAGLKFLSFEPLLGNVMSDSPKPYHIEAGKHHWLSEAAQLQASHIEWIIIGQQTPVKKSTMPKIGWIERIIDVADKSAIPIFLKDNLISCIDQYDVALKDGKYRQEFPYEKCHE